MKKGFITYFLFGALLLVNTFSYAAGCLVTDVTANGSNAFSCSGPNSGNDSAADINSIFSASNAIVWEEAAKVNIPENSNAGDVIVGDSLEATAGINGDWTYTGSDILSSPFVVVLKASEQYSAYLFKGIDLGINDTGGFLINFVNNGGHYPELSHITIYSTESDIPGTGIFGNPVPLPAALWLFGPALLGFMGFRRKAKS